MTVKEIKKNPKVEDLFEGLIKGLAILNLANEAENKELSIQLNTELSEEFQELRDILAKKMPENIITNEINLGLNNYGLYLFKKMKQRFKSSN